MSESFIKWDEIQRFFENLTGLCYFNPSKTELVCRCPFCEQDSKKGHGHLYILTDPNRLIYNCFRCEESGLLCNLLRALDLDPSTVLSPDLVDKKPDFVNKKIVIKDKPKKYNLDKESYSRYIRKKEYVRNRIGFEVYLEDIPNMIFDIKNFLIKNHIELEMENDYYLQLLEDNFIGFLGNRGTSIYFRNTDTLDTIRCMNYRIKNTESFFSDFYGIGPFNIKESMNKIVLCEGPFDLLVSYFSNDLENLKKESCMWASVLGKSKYGRCICSILDYCCLPKADFIILSDPEVEDKTYKSLIGNPQVNSLEIYKNTTGKDFGEIPIVPMKSSFFKFRNFGGFSKKSGFK